MVERARGYARVVTGGEVPGGELAAGLRTTRRRWSPSAAQDSEIVPGRGLRPGAVRRCPFDTDDEAIALANDTPYGLAASAWTRDVYRALRATREIRRAACGSTTTSRSSARCRTAGYKAVRLRQGHVGLLASTSTPGQARHVRQHRAWPARTGTARSSPTPARAPPRDQSTAAGERPPLCRPGRRGHRRRRRHRVGDRRAAGCRGRRGLGRATSPPTAQPRSPSASAAGHSPSTLSDAAPAPPRSVPVVAADRTDRCPGQQRRRQPARSVARPGAGGLDTQLHGQCRRPVPPVPGGAADHDRRRRWLHRQHRLAVGAVARPGHIAYNTSKAAVVSFTHNLARDYAPHGVRVNAVCPGEMRTPMLESNLARSGRSLADLNALCRTAGSANPRRSPLWWRSWPPTRRPT